VLASSVYNFDQATRLSTEQINGGTTTTLQYDVANQVTSDVSASYTWDSAGNRTNASFSQGSNTGNQLATDGTWTYTYDAEGHLTQKSKGASAETWVYTYDTAGNLSSAEDRPTPGGTATIHIDYKYDALGHLAERDVTTGGSTTVQRYSYDASGNVWADFNYTGGSNVLAARHLFGDGVNQVVAGVSYGGGLATVSWDLADRQGSEVGVMSNAGALLGWRRFDAFGNVVSVTGSGSFDRYGYTGLQVDASTGLLHADNR